MKRPAALARALVVTLGCVALAACGSSSDKGASTASSGSAGASSASEEKLVLSLGAFTVTYPEVFVASELGFFDDMGVDVEIQNNGTNFATVLLGGRADLAVSSPPGVFPPVDQGKETVVVAELTRGLPLALVVREDSPYREVTDLAGRRLATFPPGTGFYGISTATSDYVKEKTGEGLILTSSSSTSGDFTNQVASGAVDAAYANPEGAVPFLNQRKVRWLLPPGDPILGQILPEELVGYSLFGLRDRVEDKSEAITRMIAALRQGNAWVADHTDEEVAEVVHRVKGFDSFELGDLTQAVGYARANLVRDDGAISRERWNDVSIPVWRTWDTGVDVDDPKFSFDSRVDMRYFDDSTALVEDAGAAER